MAGRPTKKAEKITALEAQMTEVCKDFLEYLPEQYSNQRPSDPLGQAWNDTMNAISNAEDRLEDLGEMLRDKAGVTWEEVKETLTKSQQGSAKAEAAATSV